MLKQITAGLTCLIALAGFSVLRPAQAQDGDLLTPWAGDVSPDSVHPDYPRPQLVRDAWLNLNGLWEYALTARIAEPPQEYRGPILVPFPAESALSGVQMRVSVGDRLWYRRAFAVPADWAGQRVLLHFGAVDWEAVVWVNGVEVGTHRGGYDPFTFDITAALRAEGPQEIVVAVWDPTDLGLQPRGKQVSRPGGIWYTPTTGIWQTVWLEPVPDAHITGLRMTPDIDREALSLQTAISDAAAGLEIHAIARDGQAIVAGARGSADGTLELSIPDPRLWSPESPHLYDLEVQLLEEGQVVDRVTSYFGMRKIALGTGADGVVRLYLNNAPLFHFGLLDQGFWPDGLYTAPTDEALRYDIEITRRLGFNTIRKHVKVEPERWYYWADRLGVLVWQDMPSGDAFVQPGAGEITRLPVSAQQFEAELARLVDTHYNHPSIVMWVLFNEGWGQYDTARLAGWLAEYDPSRLVNSASGWNDVGAGAVFDIHSYPGPDMPPLSADRAAVLGEFGGLGLPVAGHLWQEEGAWGYRAFADAAALQEAYGALITRLAELRERGLAAAIYTQTTDVEIEANGIMTYDRAVIKMDPDWLRETNARIVPAAAD